MADNVGTLSKIVSLRIKNFMSIKDALLEFDDTNIIALCGFNDSGKSAVTRLLDIMFYNSYSTEQNRFITDDEEYWVGELTFSDGIIYTRKKYQDGKSLWELTKDGKTLFTNALPNGSLAAMSDTPDPIKQYLGVVQDELTGEELNVRRNTDKLFLINTSGGDNYKILNAVLHSETLSQASKNLNDDKNKLNQEIQEKETIQNVLTEQLSEIEIVPEEKINTVKFFVQNLDLVCNQILRLTSIAEMQEEINSIVLFDKLATIDIDDLQLLKEIMNLCQEISLPIYEKLKGIDVGELLDLQRIMELEKDSRSSLYNALEKIETDELKDLNSIIELHKSLTSVDEKYNEVTLNLDTIKGKLTELSNKYNLKVCNNCGSIVS